MENVYAYGAVWEHVCAFICVPIRFNECPLYAAAFLASGLAFKQRDLLMSTRSYIEKSKKKKKKRTTAFHDHS
jgi:hypothetical protein